MDMADIKKKFGLRLYQLRNEAGLTQAKLAGMASLSIDLISRIERGERAPSLESIEKISFALKVIPAQLLNFEGKTFEALAEGPLEAVEMLTLMKGKKPKQIKNVFDIAKIILE
jgi:transcriptional regulator with XRE-family HTH domain